MKTNRRLCLLVFFAFCTAPIFAQTAASSLSPDSVRAKEMRQTEMLLQRAEKSSNVDTIIMAQKAALQTYRRLLAEKTSGSVQHQSNYALEVELAFGLFAMFALLCGLSVKAYVARHKSKVNGLRMQMDAMDELLEVRKSVFNASAGQEAQCGHENEERIKELEMRKLRLESSLSQEDLEEVRVAQFRSNKHVQSVYRKCEAGKLLDEADWLALSHTIESIAPRALSFLEQRRPRMIEEDYRMCLLIVTGMAPKHIVRLLCCTPQKVSMQRKRYLKEFFLKDGKPAEFDTLLRTL